MPTRARRFLPLLIGVALLLPAAVPAPVQASTASDAEAIMLKTMNYERTRRGLVALRLDTRMAAIARDRSQYQAARDIGSHTHSGGRTVFDLIQSSGVKWYSAGEIIAQNRYYPTITDSAKSAVKNWLASSTHRSILLSKGYNYVGFGFAVNPDSGRRYWTGVYLKGPDRTKPWAEIDGLSRRAAAGNLVAVTVRFSGGDRKLQVLTSGFRYFQIQRRSPGGTWRSFPTQTSTTKTVRWGDNTTKEVRVRSRDRAGNWSDWQYLKFKV
jgi:uncharacterized protein YkwD